MAAQTTTPITERDFDDALDTLDRLLEMFKDPSRLTPEQRSRVAHATLAAARRAFEAGKLDSATFHRIDLMARQLPTPAETQATIAKSLALDVRAGTMGTGEAAVRARSAQDPAFRGLGAWWKSSYFRWA